MMMYSERRLSDAEMGCCSYGTGQSHEDIIEGAGGHIGNDGFKDPHPGANNPIKADRVWIKDNKIIGAEFSYSGGDHNFCCSYIGTSYQDIKDQNRMDVKKVKESTQEKYNIREGSERTRLPARVGDRGLMFDDRRLRNSFPMEIKEVKKQDNPMMYDKYNTVVNPHTGNTMTCNSIYVNTANGRHPTEETQYVELIDTKAGEHYFYRTEVNKSVDQQIKEDTERAQKRHINNSEEKDEYGVAKQSTVDQHENNGYNGGRTRW